MKWYGKDSLSKFIGIALNFIILFGIYETIEVYYKTFFIEAVDMSLRMKILVVVILTLGIGCIFYIVFLLKGMMKTLILENPFCIGNVKALTKISIACFVISGCYFINFIVNLIKGDFRFIYIDGTGIHTNVEFLIFLLAGCFIGILAKVFAQAVRYKEENDLTI
ncbi:MAG: DUF2975 domain-containing protein [Clostridium sp.]|uniref:DUF2975 domain-containing protein n=1 Tax=Clostridium sp. TaxID=1506 RepID=UPI003F33B120